MAWFNPNASVSSWFAPQPGSQAAASTTPQTPADSSFLFQQPAQQQQPQQGIAPAPGVSAPSGPNPANALTGMVGQYGRPIASALGSDYSRSLGGLLGLANLGLGASSGNPIQAAGGGISALGNFAGLLNSSPNLASALGMSGLTSAGSGLGGLSALGTVGAGAGGLGGLLGVYGGIQGLMNGGSVPSSLMQLGTGLAGTYGALSSLAPSVFPSALAAIGEAVPSLAAALPSVFGTAAGVGGGAAGAGVAGAAGASTVGLAAAPIAVAFLASQIAGMMDSQSAARDLTRRVKNISGQLPGELGQLSSIPGITAGLSSASSPDQMASILKRLNDIQEGYQSGGWENYTKTGGTSVSGGGLGKDLTANLSGVQTSLDRMYPALQSLDLGRLFGEDALGKAGWSPDQIQSATGKYVTPVDLALEMNNPATTLRNGSAGLYNAALRPDFVQQVMSGDLGGARNNPLGNSPSTQAGLSALGLDPRGSYTLGDIANFLSPGGAGQSLVTNGPLGITVNSVLNATNAIRPGQFATELPKLLAPYGGVNPVFRLS